MWGGTSKRARDIEAGEQSRGWVRRGDSPRDGEGTLPHGAPTPRIVNTAVTDRISNDPSEKCYCSTRSSIKTGAGVVGVIGTHSVEMDLHHQSCQVQQRPVCA
jgi:hypothetical protein